VLTKRPDRLLAWHQSRGAERVSQHIWLGVSIESSHYLWRLDRLRQVNVPIRFVSAEPLLGPLGDIDLAGISWVITGGESGGAPARALVTRTPTGWRPTPQALAWVREIRERCEATGVAFFHKQWGGPTPKAGGRRLDRRLYDGFPVMLSDAEAAAV
jgi:protein gp37